MLVCQGVTCKGQQGADGILQDIEELCAAIKGCQLKVEPTSCLGRCGKGPNVEVAPQEKGAESKVVEGVSSFKTIEKVVKNAGDGTLLDGKKKKAATLKFEARRVEKPEEAKAKVDEALTLLGGREVASKKEPTLAGQLLALRSWAASGADALSDAEAAATLLPSWARVHLVVAHALANLGREEDANAASQRAAEKAGCPLEKKFYKIQMREVLEKAKKAKAAASAAGGKAEDQNGPCLLERLGGEEPLEVVVYGVYDLMRDDAEMGPIFERFAKTPGTMHRLKVRTVDYLRGEWGGDPYDGPNLFVAHASMEISDWLYDGMMKMYKIMLQKVKATDDVMSECLKSLEDMRPPIIDPAGIFQEEMEKTLAAAAAKNAAHRKEMKAKLDALRIAREKEAKLKEQQKDMTPKAKAKAQAKAKAEAEAAKAKAAGAPKGKAKARSKSAPKKKAAGPKKEQVTPREKLEAPVAASIPAPPPMPPEDSAPQQLPCSSFSNVGFLMVH